jgi:hypothetical protein
MHFPDFSGIDPLPLRVQWEPGETAFSLLRRLAARNHFASVSQLKSRVIGLKWMPANAWRQTVALAARLNNNDPSEIAQHTPVFSIGFCWIRGFDIPISAGKEHFQICVQCIAEDCADRPKREWDIRAYIRDWWHLDRFVYCPKHSTLLSNRCSHCRALFGDKQSSLAQCKCGLTIFQQAAGAKMEVDTVVRQEFLHFLLDTKMVDINLGLPFMPHCSKLQMLAHLGHALRRKPADDQATLFGLADQYRAYQMILKNDGDIDGLVRSTIRSAAASPDPTSNPVMFVKWLLAQSDQIFAIWQADVHAIYRLPSITASDATWAAQERRVNIWSSKVNFR